MAGLKIAEDVYETTTSVAMPNPQSRWKSHLWTLYMYGTFDTGTTAKLQISPDPTTTADASSNWFDVTNASFSNTHADEDRVINVEFRARKCRLHITGGSMGSDSITAELI